MLRTRISQPPVDGVENRGCVGAGSQVPPNAASMTTYVGGQHDLPGGGHRGLPAGGHVLTLRRHLGGTGARFEAPSTGTSGTPGETRTPRPRCSGAQITDSVRLAGRREAVQIVRSVPADRALEAVVMCVLRPYIKAVRGQRSDRPRSCGSLVAR